MDYSNWLIKVGNTDSFVGYFYFPKNSKRIIQNACNAELVAIGYGDRAINNYIKV